MNTLAHITASLREFTGLDPDRLPPGAIGRAAEQRMRAILCSDLDAYWARLQRDEVERDALIDHLVVPESWFFRDEQPFQFLRGRVRQILREQGTPLRILSVPCASGEEPYSVAITLLESGLDEESFQIQGVDISRGLIRRAGRKPYRETAFRNNLWAFQNRYFALNPAGDRLLSEKVRPLVAFDIGNLADPDFIQGRRPYHVIFCRNLMIYLHGAARERVQANLSALLVDGGWLFVGHAEGGIPRTQDYRRIDHPGAFAFVRSPKHHLRRPSRRRVLDAPRVSLPHVRPAHKPVTAPKISPPPTGEDLDAIEALANSGRMDEAEARCRQYLEVMGSTGGAHYLMGLIAVARDQKELARTHLEKSVYLEPGHAAALTHLALLAEARGDARQAERWRRKLKRAATRADSDGRAGSLEPPPSGLESAKTPIESTP